MSWRYLAYRLNGDGTETLLHPELPLSDPRVTLTLSAAPMIEASIIPEVLALKGDDGRPVLQPWSTAIFAEEGGVIRAGGILTDLDMEDEKLGLVVKGFMCYPDGQGWVDDPGVFYETDPATIFRYAWTKLQSHPGANLDLQVDSITTGMKVGKRAAGDASAGGTSDDPFVLARYHTTDLGQDLQTLLSSGNIEVFERHTWDGEAIAHRLELTYPRRGHRVDYRFVIGENILQVPNVKPNADMYASAVLVIGAGDGPAAITQYAENATPNRLRRVKALSRKDLSTAALALSYASQQLKLRSTIHDDVDDLIVRDTTYAPVASLEPGDEITVTGDAGWAGREFQQSYRVLQIEYAPESTSAAVLKVSPTDKAY